MSDAEPAAEPPASSMSLFELPSARRARRTRIGLVLALDAILIGAGVWLMAAYAAARTPPPPGPDAGPGEARAAVEVMRATPAAPPAVTPLAGDGSARPLDAGPVAAAAGGPPGEVAAALTEALAAAVDGHRAELQRCYARAARASTGAPLGGTIVLRFTLVPGGHFERVTVQENDTGSPQLATCLVGRVEEWIVPPGPQAALDLEWPFRFRSQP